jgi:hypothetical protein
MGSGYRWFLRLEGALAAMLGGEVRFIAGFPVRLIPR